MRLMLPAVGTKLLHFQTLCRRFLILGLAVVSILALVALKLNNFAWHISRRSF